MRIKVNKYQIYDDWERDYHRLTRSAGLNGDISVSFHYNVDNFETEDVTPEQLLEYIDKGYGIKINC